MRMRIIAAAVAAFGVFGVASAQTAAGSGGENDYYPYNFSVRGGIAFPIDDNYSNQASSLLALGVEYTFGKSLLPNGETYFSLDYLAKDVRTIGGDGTVTPIAINQRFFLQRRADGNRTYAFVGLGASFVNYGQSNTVFSGRGGVGLELGPRIFTEATLFLGDNANGLRPDALAIYLGYRF